MKLRKEKQKKSIFLKILLPMVALVIIEVALLGSTVFGGGLISFMDKNATDILHERVLNRKNFMESEMVNRWSNVQNTVQNINAMTRSLIDSGAISLDTFDNGSVEAEPLLSQVSNELIALMRSNSVTGSFIVINTHPLMETDVSNKPGLYFRDLDPVSTPSVKNMDLLLECGSVSVARSLEISMDSNWKPTFEFNGEGTYSSYFYKPYMAAYKAKEKANFSEYGYWTCGKVTGSNSEDALTYSVPLILDDGTVYGVLGIDLTVDYINKVLPYNELAESGLGSYALIRKVEKSDAYENMIISGMLYNQEIGLSSLIKLNKAGNYLYNIETTSGESDFVCSIEFLNLYNTNTNFDGEKWAIVGTLKSQDMFSASQQISSILIIAIFVTFVFGVLGTAIISFIIAKPVTRLTKEMGESDATKDLCLERTGISEIDSMVSSIEALRHDVIDSATKFSKIIEMASVRLAGFELDYIENSLFVTDHFFEIFEKPELDGNLTTIESFQSALDNFSEYIVDEKTTWDKILYKIPKNDSYVFVMLNCMERGHRFIGLAEDVTSNMNEVKTLEYERDHDILTGLINRRAFYNRMKVLFGEEQDSLKVAAIVMIDLDNLKMLNDAFGHDCGDKYIKSAAKCFVENTPEGTIVTRVSGDEFYIVFYGYDSEEEIQEKIDVLKDAVYECTIELPNQQSCYLRVSAGISWYPKDAQTYDLLLKCSDFAMYCVKRSGKGAFGNFDRNSYLQEENLVQNKEELAEIIEKNQLYYCFQPIVDVKTAKVVAYEALMRADMPTLNSPDKILSIAKMESKLNSIEVLTWFNSLESFSEHVKQGVIDKNCKIFINSIASQSMNSEEMAEFENIYGDLLPNIVLEITEEERLDEAIHYFKSGHIHAWNGAIALDDYGSGYNSEKSLLYIDPQYIKVDSDIIHNIDASVDKQKIVRNIVSYAHERGKLIVAEGVENENELRTAVELGVDLLQGYFLGRPTKVPNGIYDNAKEYLLSLLMDK